MIKKSHPIIDRLLAKVLLLDRPIPLYGDDSTLKQSEEDKNTYPADYSQKYFYYKMIRLFFLIFFGIATFIFFELYQEVTILFLLRSLQFAGPDDFLINSDLVINLARSLFFFSFALFYLDQFSLKLVSIHWQKFVEYIKLKNYFKSYGKVEILFKPEDEYIAEINQQKVLPIVEKHDRRTSILFLILFLIVTFYQWRNYVLVSEDGIAYVKKWGILYEKESFRDIKDVNLTFSRTIEKKTEFEPEYIVNFQSGTTISLLSRMGNGEDDRKKLSNLTTMLLRAEVRFTVQNQPYLLSYDVSKEDEIEFFLSLIKEVQLWTYQDSLPFEEVSQLIQDLVQSFYINNLFNIEPFISSERDVIFYEVSSSSYVSVSKKSIIEAKNQEEINATKFDENTSEEKVLSKKKLLDTFIPSKFPDKITVVPAEEAIDHIAFFCLDSMFIVEVSWPDDESNNVEKTLFFLHKSQDGKYYLIAVYAIEKAFYE